jgi:histidinol-phosphatase
MTGLAGADETGYGSAWSAGRRRVADEALQAWLEVALQIADEADALAMGGFRQDLHISTKPDHSLVTQVDEAIERHVRDRLLRAFPDHGVVGEEFGEAAGSAGTRWYVDPIDATHNFVRGVPIFATLLAAEQDGELQLGVVSAPAMGERWLAWRGGGAWAVRTVGSEAGHRRPIGTSRVDQLQDASIAYSSPSPIEGLAPGFRALLDAVWRDRGFGDFWGYMLLAEGAVDAMVEVDVNAWDLAAPSLIVEEAGGRISDLAGRRTFLGPTMLASNGRLHDRLLRAMQEVP